jgi:hypothetical protein
MEDREPDLRGLNPVSCAPPKQLVTGQALSQRKLHVPTWEYAPLSFRNEVSQNWTVKPRACWHGVAPSWLQNSPNMKVSCGLFSPMKFTPCTQACYVKTVLVPYNRKPELANGATGK